MNQAKDPLEYCVISHTHWDREWYAPLERFRLRLVDLIDHVLAIFDSEPDYIFHLDAQTIVLDDYLEIRPQRRACLERHIREGRLLVGPWYVQNDLYLTSGESTVRNLLIGTAMAEQYGKCGKVGYTPDQFGIIGQLPQILRGFGIDNCIFGRGYSIFDKDAEGHWRPRPTSDEFTWRGADGTPVLAIFMRYWYNNAQRFPADPVKAMKFLEMIEGCLSATSKSSHRLLMNGVDHLEAQEDLLPILASLNERLGDKAIIHQTTLDGFVKKTQACLADTELEQYQGELRNGPDPCILHGTLSARVYLKQANVRSQALLENMLEPLYTMIAAAGHPDIYPCDHLRYLWKTLIQNHPHDSICGCSCDPVHSHMEDRFERVDECAGDLVHRGMAFLCDRISRDSMKPDSYFILIANTTGSTRDEVVTAAIKIPETEGVKAFKLLGPSGEMVPFEVLQHSREMVTLTSPINLPGQVVTDAYKVRFLAKQMAPLSQRVYRIKPLPGEVCVVSASQPRKLVTMDFENELLRVSLDEGGQVNLTNKRSGHVFSDILALEDEADLGTAYLHETHKSGLPIRISDTPPTVSLIESTPFQKTLELAYEPMLPAYFDFDADRRSTETVKNPITIRCTLRAGSPRLDLDVWMDNKAKDHRLRLIVNTDLATDLSRASAPFDIVNRDRRVAHDNVRQEPSEPNSGLIMVGEGVDSLGVMNEGLYEYEHRMDTRNSLAITLWRATGYIFYETGQRLVSEEWLVPGNQCLREANLRLAIAPGLMADANPEARFREFLTPLIWRFEAADSHKLTGGRPCVQDSELQEIFYRDPPKSECCLPLDLSAFSLEGDAVVLSAVKRAEVGGAFLIRVYNPYEKPADSRLMLPKGARDAQLLALDESSTGALAMSGGVVTVELAPKGIATVGFTISL